VSLPAYWSVQLHFKRQTHEQIRPIGPTYAPQPECTKSQNVRKLQNDNSFLNIADEEFFKHNDSYIDRIFRID